MSEQTDSGETGLTGQDSGNSPDGGDKQPVKSASTLLVEIALERFDFGVSDSGDAFAIPKTGPRVVGMLRGGKTSLRGQLARAYFERHGKAPSQQAIADALLVVEGFAADAEETRLYLRVAEHDGTIWLDLADTSGQAVRVTAEGWQVEIPPVKFKRTTLNSPLPEPATGGHLEKLWDWLNVAEADRPLILAWLVAAFIPDIPHPVLGLFGEQGTGKSTAEKLLVSLVDPSPVPLRQPPRDKEAWVTAAAGSWLVGLDNLSHIPGWLSDTICRAVTGDGDVRRRLYTDGDLATFAFRRCVILNGIDLGALPGDLADRVLPVELQRIGEGARREESDMWPQWTESHPLLLGALLELVASVKAILPVVVLSSKPRMADFARVVAAVDKVIGTDGLERYVGKQSTMARDSLTADPFVTALADWIKDTFTGTAAELLAKVTPSDEGWRAPKGWPGSPRAVTTKLKRQSPPMRKAGWDISDDGGANERKSVKWTITPATGQDGSQGLQESSPKQPPSNPSDPSNGNADGSTGHTGHDSRFSLDSGASADNPSISRKPCRWWIGAGGVHGDDCEGCRTAPAGPDHPNGTNR